MVWEDLHWADPSTLELLSLWIERIPTARILMLVTCRPHFTLPWSARPYLTALHLNRLTPQQVEVMVRQIAGGRALPAEIVQHIIAKTDGVPLFVEELTKMVLESGLLKEEAGRYVEAAGQSSLSLAIPATLQDSLMARFDRLVTAKGVAQLAATLGREFSYELLRAVASEDEELLQQGLRRLVEAEFVYQNDAGPTATYVFKHALIRDTAYQSLLKSTRQQYHQRIAQVLERRFPETAETQPALLAHHYTEAGLSEPAIGYWQRAGEHASNRSANLEAVSHFTTGIKLLTALPETPERTQQALTLHIALGAALRMAKGYAAPEVEQAYTQAHALCQQVGETLQLAPVLLGLCGFYLVRPQLHKARELGDTLLRLAHQAHDPALSVVAHHALGQTLLWLGALPAARMHLETGMPRYTPEQRRALVFRTGQDLGCFLPSLYRHDPGVAGVPGSGPDLSAGCHGVGT
jgi:predicted ATPase